LSSSCDFLRKDRAGARLAPKQNRHFKLMSREEQ
jgi:hypothetical protein